jgi:hypothetical protein
MNLDVLVPVSPSLPDAISIKAHNCAAHATYAHPDINVRYVWYSGAGNGADRIERLADVRNQMLQYIDARADFAAFVDADVFYPPGIFSRLPFDARTIAAPLVMVEDDEERFYDTAGFQGATGLRFQHRAPYLRMPHFEVAACQSVGSFYVFPAWLAKECRFAAKPGPVEHQAFCAMARARDCRVVCHFGVRVYHANLPKYGEEWH